MLLPCLSSLFSRAGDLVQASGRAYSAGKPRTSSSALSGAAHGDNSQLGWTVSGCLRELDAELVGLGGLNVGGTMDAAVGASRPWWGRWSGHDYVERQPECNDLAAMINKVESRSSRPSIKFECTASVHGVLSSATRLCGCATSVCRHLLDMCGPDILRLCLSFSLRSLGHPVGRDPSRPAHTLQQVRLHSQPSALSLDRGDQHRAATGACH